MGLTSFTSIRANSSSATTCRFIGTGSSRANPPCRRITVRQVSIMKATRTSLPPISSLNGQAPPTSKNRTKDKPPPGKVKIEVETSYIVPKPAGPLNVTLKVNGKQMAEGTVLVSTPLAFTANDCLDIGQALDSPVSLDYRAKAPFKFNGTIEQVHIKYS